MLFSIPPKNKHNDLKIVETGPDYKQKRKCNVEQSKEVGENISSSDDYLYKFNP